MSPQFRRARAGDAALVTDIYLRSRAGAGDAIPPGVHPPDEVRAYVADVLLPDREVWTASSEDEVVAVLVLDGEDLHWLWVLPERQGRGVGAALLEHAKSLRPKGLALWVFTSNMPARRFYEKHGFVAVRETDGDNEEGAPDVRYVWGDHPDSS